MLEVTIHLTAQIKTRQDRLYVLAEVCRQKGINPNHTAYMGTIIGVCAANFNIPKNKAREYAQILTSAYKQDKWETILGATTPQPKGQTTFFNSEPTANTPKQDALILKGMAKRDTFNGVGRLILSEVQLEIGKASPEEIMETWETYNHKDTIEQSGKVFLIYWGGKADVKETRNLQPIRWNTPAPSMMGSNDIYKEPAYEKDCEPAADKLRVGEVSEDDAGVVNEDE
jgi:hypothetical protein